MVVSGSHVGQTKKRKHVACKNGWLFLNGKARLFIESSSGFEIVITWCQVLELPVWVWDNFLECPVRGSVDS